MTTVRLAGIHPHAWEHPTDRAALGALQKIPGFDTLVRRVVGTFGETNIRMLFQANAIKVGPNQYPDLHEALKRVCWTLDADVPELYVSQGPIANAGAVGVDKPFIVLNSSLIEIGKPQEVEAVLGHEVAHIMSGHALYRTLLFLLLRLVAMRSSLITAATMPITLALLEWSRKAEISCDRAGLLAVQDPDASLGVLAVLAGGIRGEGQDINLEAFIEQSDEYRDAEGLSAFFRFMTSLGQTHPFAVVRVAELRNWIESGAYHQIIGGEYRTTEDDTPLREDVTSAARDFSSSARQVFDDTDEYVTKTFNRLIERVEVMYTAARDAASEHRDQGGAADQNGTSGDGDGPKPRRKGDDDNDPLDGYMDDWPMPQ